MRLLSMRLLSMRLLSMVVALSCVLPVVYSWRVCNVAKLPYGAIGDGVTKDTHAIQSALSECDEVWLPAGRSFLSGPLNLTSNQVFRVDGTLLASTDRHDYALIAPLMGYGWGDDENCFAPDRDSHKIIIGSLRYTPVIGAYHSSNVTLTGSGVIDGQGQIWWENCTKCHYTPGNDSSFCEIASRPKLIETQYVDGFRVLGSKALEEPSSKETVQPPPGMEVCRITTAEFKIETSKAVSAHPVYDAYVPSSSTGYNKHTSSFCGNTDGIHTHHAPIAFGNSTVTFTECQNMCHELKCTCFDFLGNQAPTPAPTPDPTWSGTLTLQNSPFWTLTPSYTQNIHVADLRILAPIDRIGNTDGVNLDSCRNVLVENIWIQNSDDGVCIKSGLNGYGLNLGIPTENVLIRNITCPKGGRGGFAIGSEMSGGMRNITYRDSVLHGERGIDIKPSVGRGGYIHDLTFENIDTNGVNFGMGSDGKPLMDGNHYVPLISNLHFVNVRKAVGQSFGNCAKANRSKCFNLTVDGKAEHWPDLLPPQTFACKKVAKTMFGTVNLPWPVCIPLDAPVNLRPDYPNYGPATGNYASLAECKSVCS